MFNQKSIWFFQYHIITLYITKIIAQQQKKNLAIITRFYSSPKKSSKNSSSVITLSFITIESTSTFIFGLLFSNFSGSFFFCSSSSCQAQGCQGCLPFCHQNKAPSYFSPISRQSRARQNVLFFVGEKPYGYF